MNLCKLFISCLPVLASFGASAGNFDYTKGIIFVNEDWYGHQNSTINILFPDATDGNYWQYRAFQEENPGHELGCTNQYGAIWDGRLFLIAKQEKDPGASITGGRITVADGKSLKMLFQSTIIDPSGAQCDGRGFVGVDKHKGYISSSNGIWIFDLDSYTVTGQVSGSGNPNADGDSPVTDPTGSLYHGQTGTMVEAQGKIFAAHQQYGILVIDPAQDKVENTISMDIVKPGAGVGSIVKSKDGSLWASVAPNTQGMGMALPYIVKIDPTTLKTKVIPIEEPMYAPLNSWYAWTPDAFVASTVNNCLYWKGGSNRWFSGSKIYKFDISTETTSLFIDLDADNEDWKLYGCSIGVHPITDEIYMSLYHEFGKPTYITRRYANDGSVIRDYDMIMNYWFPSLPLFPEAHDWSAITETNTPDTDLYMQDNRLYTIGFANSTIDIYTLSGIKTRSIVPQYQAESFNLDLTPGIYLARTNTMTKKIVIR